MIATLRRMRALRGRARALPEGPARDWILRALAAQAGLAAVAGLGRALDPLVAPGLSEVPVRAPVFVLGHPRSGTTRLHRLLAQDPRFTAVTAWEALLPSISVQRLLRGLGRLDQRLGERGARALRDFEQVLVRELSQVHPTGFSAVEEDELLRVRHADAPWYTVGALADPALFRGRWMLDQLPDRAEKVADYAASVRRHLHEHQGVWLSKNPHHLGALDSLGEAFPDGRFIQVVRDPEEAIASQLSLYQAAWRVVDPRVDPRGPELREMFDVCCDLYRHGAAAWARIPDDRRCTVRFSTLLADPAAALDAIYLHFGWTMDAATAAGLQAEPRGYVPRRVPSLRQMGIPAAALADRLGDLDGLWRDAGRRPPRGRA
jgi:hypothetical protein